MHVAGLNGVLAVLGMADISADDATGTAEPTFLNGSIWPHTRQAGWWEPVVAPGDFVAGSEVLGTVSTLDGGEVLETITAPTDGVIMFVTSSPAVAADGLLLGLGRLES